jgi:hypothetical protein
MTYNSVRGQIAGSTSPLDCVHDMHIHETLASMFRTCFDRLKRSALRPDQWRRVAGCWSLVRHIICMSCDLGCFTHAASLLLPPAGDFIGAGSFGKVFKGRCAVPR